MTAKAREKVRLKKAVFPPGDAPEVDKIISNIPKREIRQNGNVVRHKKSLRRN